MMKITIVKSHECAATDFRSDDGKDANPLHGGRGVRPGEEGSSRLAQIAR